MGAGFEEQIRDIINSDKEDFEKVDEIYDLIQPWMEEQVTFGKIGILKKLLTSNPSYTHAAARDLLDTEEERLNDHPEQR